MREPRMIWLPRSIAVIVLTWFLSASMAMAAPPPDADSRTPKAKPAKSGTKSASAAISRKPPSLDILDSGDARDTLESTLENYQIILAVIANNIANAETPAFKRSHVIVADLCYRQEGRPGIQDSSGLYSPNGYSVGWGSQIAGTAIDFRQGRLMRTGRPLDLAIEGRSFFQVLDPSSNTYVYSRAGQFTLNSCGQIVVRSAKVGRLLEPAITLPNDATDISISADGVVSYRTPGQQTLSQAGIIQLASFVNPEGLVPIGENLYEESDGSGTPQTGNPGTSGFGKLRQGWIETSNVDLRQEMTEWKRIRRACREIRSLLEEP